MINDTPRLLLKILSAGFILLLIVLLVFEERLPERIIGINKILCFLFLIAGAIGASWGGRFLGWFRRRNF
jgi:hypothetical protein